MAKNYYPMSTEGHKQSQKTPGTKAESHSEI